jgi:hypothetical protein
VRTERDAGKEAVAHTPHDRLRGDSRLRHRRGMRDEERRGDVRDDFVGQAQAMRPNRIRGATANRHETAAAKACPVTWLRIPQRGALRRAGFVTVECSIVTIGRVTAAEFHELAAEL